MIKFKFRFTILSILLSLILSTVAVLGAVTYFNAHATIKDLSKQRLEQTLLRIDQKIQDLLFTTSKQVELNDRLLNSSQHHAKNFKPLAHLMIWSTKLVTVICLPRNLCRNS